MQDDNVKVTSVVVQHPPVTPALGYRFDFPDRSIAFSGDTARSEAVAQMAKGADILVHEALDFPAIEVYLRHGIAADPEGPTFEASMAHMLADHTSAEDVGRIAQEAGVKTLVLSHIAPPSVSDASWHAAAAKFFKGEIIVGHDLMVI
jgi:ribonuclease BN (tRNA processing enzyme)